MIGLLLLAGCGEAEPPRTLAVFAASSLTEAFGDLERSFEAEHPDVDVQLTFAGSQVLRMQIEQGASADVFASADERHLGALVAHGLVHDPRVFASNAIVVIAAPDSALRRFEDLARAERIVVGTERVPVGAYTRELWQRARASLGDELVDAIEQHVVSEESNVRLVRAKVELGEADAAFVYRSDVSERVRAIEVPDALSVRARYPVGVVAPSELADAFVAHLLGPVGRDALRRHGLTPEAR